MGLSFITRKTKKRDRVVAVDLGARSTKAVQLQRRGDRITLLDFAIVDAPIFEKTLSVEALSEHLRKVVASLDGGRTKQISVSIGVSETLFRQVEVPLMPVSDLRLMLKFNSKTYLQQELPDHVFDCCYVLSRAGQKFDGAKPAGTPKHKALVGGVRKRTIDEMEAAVKGAGLVADQVVPGLIGPPNAFELAEPELFAKEVVALVDIGFKHSTITILDAGEIMLNRVVAIGGDRITAGLVEALGVGYTEAENIKIGMASEVQPSLELILNPLGRELRASIDFFEHQQDKAVSQVLISGGSSRSEFIIQTLQAELMVPCKTWLPTRSMELSLPPQKMGEIEQIASQLTVAIGAAAAAL